MLLHRRRSWDSDSVVSDSVVSYSVDSDSVVSDTLVSDSLVSDSLVSDSVAAGTESPAGMPTEDALSAHPARARHSAGCADGTY
jgi:hypothetical protein